MQPENLALTAAQWASAKQHNGVSASIEASDLGLKAGEWPTRITLPDGEVLQPLKSTPDHVVYGNDIQHLWVWND